MNIEITVGFATACVDLDDSDMLAEMDNDDILEHLEGSVALIRYKEETIAEFAGSYLKGVSLETLFAEIERRVNL